MAVIIDHKRRVKEYFIAWKTYDIKLLESIFWPSAKYVIRGKRTLDGIDEIIKYWEKNERRQEGIELHWKIIKSSFRCEVVEFGAYFFDRESRMNTKVNGQIIFAYRDDKIIKLTEAYKKRVIENRIRCEREC